jgi:hypothetical protein
MNPVPCRRSLNELSKVPANPKQWRPLIQRAIYAAADGDCLFHCLTFCLNCFGVRKTSAQLRSLAIKLLAEQWERYAAFVPHSKSRYLWAMLKPGCFVDHAVVDAAARVCNVSLLVLTDTRTIHPTLVNPGRDITFVLHLRHEHYNVVPVFIRGKPALPK